MTRDSHPTKQAAWRQAVRQVMREATQQELLNRYGSHEVSFNYRWEHVISVVNIAIKLAQLTGADQDVVEAAAWLHDVRKGEGEKHALAGAEFARNFLPQTDFPATKVEHVAFAIEAHIGLWRDEPLTDLEAMVLWDADKLSKIGLTAAFHWTGGTLAGFRPTSIREIITNGRRAEWRQKTVDSMHTEPARRAARLRQVHYDWLWTTLEDELEGNDL
ncbi:MAG: HD domain-containing protein [Candidatus Promineifilaceae bacterium]|nr:HD domain-containing protein [Candidatus Promineifilaceae bacterium]